MGGRHANGRRDNGPRHRFDWESHETSDEQRERELKRSQDENRQLRAEVKTLKDMMRVVHRVVQPFGREHGDNKVRVPPHRSTTAWGGRAR